MKKLLTIALLCISVNVSAEDQCYWVCPSADVEECFWACSYDDLPRELKLTAITPTNETNGQSMACGIKPMAPVAQTGCYPMTATCVCNSNGQCWWEWSCN